MTFKKFSLILLMVAMGLIFIVACNSEVEDKDQAKASVSFAPAVSKALNQGGSDAGTSVDVNNYYWEVNVKSIEHGDSNADTADAASNFTLDENGWRSFVTEGSGAIVEKGLGIVTDLQKGKFYVFGLRGYNDTSKKELIWEGYTYKDENDPTSALLAYNLKSKKTLVKITVQQKGKGYVFFNISAPVFAYWNIDENGNPIKRDRFMYSFKPIDSSKTASGTNIPLEGTTYSSDSDAFFYATPVDDGIPLEAGDYMFTVWQETWDSESKGGEYVPVAGRKQVLIARVNSGINTVIAGSLDSTSGLYKLDYNADGYTSETQYGIYVSFTDANTSDVTHFSVTVRSFNSPTNVYAKATTGNFEIGILPGDKAVVEWTAPTSYTDLRIFVNGDELATNTDGTFATTKTNAEGESYCYRKGPLTQDQVEAEVREITWVNTSGTNALVLKGEKDKIYLLTIQYKTETGEAKSVVFSVQGDVVLVQDILLDTTELTLTLEPGVKFTDANGAWTNAGLEEPTIVYYKVETEGATTGGTKIEGSLTNNSTPGYYYAEIYAPGTTDITGKTPLTILTTEVKAK